MLRTLSLYSSGMVKAYEMGPKDLEHFILCKLGTVLNYEQKFSNTINIVNRNLVTLSIGPHNERHHEWTLLVHSKKIMTFAIILTHWVNT